MCDCMFPCNGSCDLLQPQVISPGLLWLKDAKLSTRDLQLLSLSIEVQQKELKKLATWTLVCTGSLLL